MNLGKRDIRINRGIDTLVIEVFSIEKWYGNKSLFIFMFIWLLGIVALSNGTFYPSDEFCVNPIWLVIWVFGIGFVSLTPLWDLLKLEKITLNKKQLKIENTLFGYGTKKEYDTSLIHKMIFFHFDAESYFSEKENLGINKEDLSDLYKGEVQFNYGNKTVKFAESISKKDGLAILEAMNKSNYLDDNFIFKENTAPASFVKKIGKKIKNIQGRGINIQEKSNSLIVEIQLEKSWVLIVCFTFLSMLFLCFLLRFIFIMLKGLFLDGFQWIYILAVLFLFVSILLVFGISNYVYWSFKGTEKMTINKDGLRIEKKDQEIVSTKYNLELIRNMEYYYDSGYYNLKGETKFQTKSEGGGMIRFKYENKIIIFANNITESDGMKILEKMKSSKYLNDDNFAKS